MTSIANPSDRYRQAVAQFRRNSDHWFLPIADIDHLTMWIVSTVYNHFDLLSPIDR